MPKPAMPTAADMVADLIDNTALLSHDSCPFRYHIQPGSGQVVVMAGDNATGKSLLASMVASKAYHSHGVEPMVVSMTARTSSGMLRAFTYGGEDYRATGEVSLHVSFKALRGLAQRLEENPKGRTLAILDEPDVGLAEGFSYAFGQKIAQHINDLPANNRWNVLIVSHSREMVRGLADHLEAVPTFIHAGEACTLSQWVDQRPRHGVEALDAMIERAGGQIRQVRQILDEREAQDKPARRRKPQP